MSTRPTNPVEGTGSRPITPPDLARVRLVGVRREPRDPGPDLRRLHRDPALPLVRAGLEAYWRGERAAAAARWDPEITWLVRGQAPVSGEHAGAGEIFAYRARLGRLSGQTWVQRLIALDGGGFLISAHVRTTAQRKGRFLDIPTLLLFELSMLGVRRVTELPGDQEAWDAFWV